MKLQRTFDPDEWPDTGGKWKPGRYICTIEDEEQIESKAGNNMLVMKFKNEHGQIISTNFNVWHKDTEVREIAFRQVANLARACGIGKFDDTEVFLARKVGLIVIDDKRDDRYSTISGFYSPSIQATGIMKSRTAAPESSDAPTGFGPTDSAIQDEIPF